MRDSDTEGMSSSPSSSKPSLVFKKVSRTAAVVSSKDDRLRKVKQEFHRMRTMKKKPNQPSGNTTAIQPKPLDIDKDVDTHIDIDIDSDSDTASIDRNKTPEKNKKTNSKKRQRQRQHHSPLNRMALTLPIPIPSFRMMNKRGKSDDDSRLKKLSALERAFFDSDDETETNNKTETDTNNGVSGEERYGDGETHSDGCASSGSVGNGDDTVGGLKIITNTVSSDKEINQKQNQKQKQKNKDEEIVMCRDDKSPPLPLPSLKDDNDGDGSKDGLYSLEHHIDLLFLKTDTNTITMKMFCKALARQIGTRKLDSTTKKQVKTRVLSLLKGGITPNTNTCCDGTKSQLKPKKSNRSELDVNGDKIGPNTKANTNANDKGNYNNNEAQEMTVNVDADADATESEDSDFGGDFSSSFLDSSRPKQHENNKDKDQNQEQSKRLPHKSWPQPPPDDVPEDGKGTTTTSVELKQHTIVGTTVEVSSKSSGEHDQEIAEAVNTTDTDKYKCNDNTDTKSGNGNNDDEEDGNDTHFDVDFGVGEDSGCECVVDEGRNNKSTTNWSITATATITSSVAPNVGTNHNETAQGASSHRNGKTKQVALASSSSPPSSPLPGKNKATANERETPTGSGAIAIRETAIYCEEVGNSLPSVTTIVAGAKDSRRFSRDNSSNNTTTTTTKPKSSVFDFESFSNDENKDPSNPEPRNQTKPKTKNAAKAKRQRKSKPKIPEGGNTPAESTATADAEKKTNRPRKRPRKAAACALCKTCPCQRTHGYNDGDNNNPATALDMKNFSRSEGAVERTLMRRLQKLEKSTEHLEEQTEAVRRRLKKHRRDVWKRKARDELNSNTDTTSINRTADSYFLPDAEIFEQQQNEGQGLSRRIVEKAQAKIFQIVPTYQPTLFEMMGIPRDSDKTKQNTDRNGDQCGNTMANIGEERVSLNAEEYEGGDDDTPTEYVPERKCDDEIHRLEWNKNGETNSTDEDSGIPSGSIFDTVQRMTHDRHDDIDNHMNTRKGKPLPLWDDLFEPKNSRDKKEKAADIEAGLDDLLCLFEDDGVTGDSNGDTNCLDSVQSSNKDEQHRIDVALLSQGAQEVAKGVISGVLSREKTATSLESSCPNWKENVYFALTQKDPSDIRNALENVQQSRMRMEAQKEQLLKAWECKHAALVVFETALKTSFDRSNPNVSYDDTH